MTRAELAKMAEAIKAGKRCAIPSPNRRGVTARIMAYSEGWVMMRHKRATPFVVHVDVVLFMIGMRMGEVDAE